MNNIRKTFLKIILTTLFLVIFLDSNILAEPEIVENLSAQEAYYKEKPWDFVEQKLTILPTQKIGLFSGALGIFILISLPTVMGAHFCCKSELLAIAGIIVGAVSAGYFYYHEYYLTTCKMLIKVLNQYDPNLNNLGKYNTKNYIPHELRQTFDSLWLTYQKEGQAALKKEWASVLNLIDDKIKYELKPAKYVPPVTNVTVINR